jgi:hypothetical protein
MTDIEWTLVLLVILAMCGTIWKLMDRRDHQLSDRVKKSYDHLSEIDEDAYDARILMGKIVAAKRMKKRRSHLEAELQAIRSRQLARSVGLKA